MSVVVSKDITDFRLRFSPVAQHSLPNRLGHGDPLAIEAFVLPQLLAMVDADPKRLQPLVEGVRPGVEGGWQRHEADVRLRESVCGRPLLAARPGPPVRLIPYILLVGRSPELRYAAVSSIRHDPSLHLPTFHEAPCVVRARRVRPAEAAALKGSREVELGQRFEQLIKRPKHVRVHVHEDSVFERGLRVGQQLLCAQVVIKTYLGEGERLHNIGLEVLHQPVRFEATVGQDGDADGRPARRWA
mmetsp:Transcript_29041/g.60952  ORF Transcript_29041/g.60952 Transcript_29041/m.60952 type:complete len:244 (-) Transcript_29041:774-1505(-)